MPEADLGFFSSFSFPPYFLYGMRLLYIVTIWNARKKSLCCKAAPGGSGFAAVLCFS
jgi:hypothetical protein